MLDILPFVKKIAPDLLDEFVGRYQILKTIHVLEPTGRRAVSQITGLSERIVRGEALRLKGDGLVEITKNGMTVTKDGLAALLALEGLIKGLSGITELEKQIQGLLGVNRVMIVQGDSDKNISIKKDLGRVGAQAILSHITKDTIIAVTGGSTMADIVQSLTPQQSPKATLVVAARGSVGGKIEFQADTLAVNLANKLMANYRLLHIPDNLGKKAMAEMKNEPNIFAAIKEMQKADILVFGVGSAIDMAKKRRLTTAIVEFLERRQAVGEAFGHYFNAQGEVVYTSRSMGITMEAAKKMPFVIMAAGGAKKAKCIMSVSKNMKNSVLITDEGAALEMLLIATASKE